MVLYLRKNGASGPEAEDAAQEAMTDAYRSWDRIRSPRAWVRRAAFRSYLRHVRKLRRESPALEAEDALMADRISRVEGSEPDEQWRVIAVMRRLPPEQRKVAALFYDGFSLAEIAEVVGKPAGTVRSLLRHARLRLREVILSEGVDSPGVTQ